MQTQIIFFYSIYKKQVYTKKINITILMNNFCKTCVIKTSDMNSKFLCHCQTGFVNL